MDAKKQCVVLSQAFHMTKKEAKQTFQNLKRVGLIPDDMEVEFVTVPGAPVIVRGGSSGSTAGARWLRKEVWA